MYRVSSSSSPSIRTWDELNGENLLAKAYIAIKKQLLLPNKVRLALDGWTSTNKLAITSLIAY